MKVYELKMLEGGKGVFKVSTVKDPAIEDTLLYFSKEKDEITFFANEEKRMFYAPAMIPNKMIFRRDVNGEPAQVYYTAETVEKAQINYFRQNGNTANNVNHSENADAQGLFPCESWIVQDFNSDKSKTLGFNVPNGTWMMGYKVDNDEIWNDIKEGKLDGLSIEATHLEHEFKKEINMSTEKKEEKSEDGEILSWLKSLFAKEKMADEKPKEEDIAPIEEEKPKEEMADVPVVEVEVEEPEPTEKEQALMDEILTLKQTIAELEAEKVKEATTLETMKAELVKMKKETPAAKSVINAPSIEKHTIDKPYEQMSRKEKLQFNRENK